ncbi:hypothetical protein JL722_5828 [Aureococcus anophagefferens]|nr:hypothetical protein JL722_5828 [Aureococcus anophagefferens]
MAASLDFFGDAPEPPPPPTPAPKSRTKAAGAAADAGAPAPWSDDDVRAFRKRLRLRVESEDAVPRPWASWDDGNLDGRLRRARGVRVARAYFRAGAGVPRARRGPRRARDGADGLGQDGRLRRARGGLLLAGEKRRNSRRRDLSADGELVAQIAREAARVLRGCGIEDAVAAAPWSGDVVARSSVLVSTPLREL